MANSKRKKISAFIPADLLAQAQEALDLNQTDTLISGLREIVERNKRIKLLKNLPKISIKHDVDIVRQRQVR